MKVREKVRRLVQSQRRTHYALIHAERDGRMFDFFGYQEGQAEVNDLIRGLYGKRHVSSMLDEQERMNNHVL